MLTLSFQFAPMGLFEVHAKPDTHLSAADTSAPAGQLEAINLRVLGQLQELDPGGLSGLMERVLLTYRKSLARLMRQLALGRDEADQAAVRLVAHTLKSSSASIGALTLSEACAAVEQAVREGRSDALPGLLRRLESEALRADGAVAQLLANGPLPAR